MAKRTGIALGLLLILAGTVSLAGQPGTAEPAGVVLATVGTVTIQRDAASIPAARRSNILLHDEIRTGDQARAQLRFADGTVTTLGGNTTFRVNRFTWQADAGNQPPASVEMELVSGAFRTITGKVLEREGAQFNVRTPAGSLGIRGTDFWGGFLDGDAVDVLLIEGDHAVTVTNSKGSVLLEKAGQGTTLKADQSALAVKTWPQLKVDRAVATIGWPDNGEIPEGALKAPPPLPPFDLKDQHGASHTLGDDVKRIYYTRDMVGGKLMKKVFGADGQRIIDGQHTIAISNMGGMNAFIRNTMALPALKKRPYTIWIDDRGLTDDLPYKENHVTVLDVSNRNVTNTRFIGEQKILREIAGLPH